MGSSPDHMRSRHPGHGDSSLFSLSVQWSRSPKPTMHTVLALVCLAAAASAMPYTYYPAQYIPADEMLVRVPRQVARPQAPYIADQEASADTAYGAAPVGRVKIQVYRGPSKGTGYDAHAPWGYYNTQPVDLHKH